MNKLNYINNFKKNYNEFAPSEKKIKNKNQAIELLIDAVDLFDPVYTVEKNKLIVTYTAIAEKIENNKIYNFFYQVNEILKIKDINKFDINNIDDDVVEFVGYSLC